MICSMESKCKNAKTARCSVCINNKKFKYLKNWYWYNPPYTPVCPASYEDCVNDPGYVKHYYPNWYKDMYGDIPPEEAIYTYCKATCKNVDGCITCADYDDEDK